VHYRGIVIDDALTLPERTAIGGLVGLFVVLSKANELIAAGGAFITAIEGRNSSPILLAEPVVAVREQ
jgi:hypothetical protein